MLQQQLMGGADGGSTQPPLAAPTATATRISRQHPHFHRRTDPYTSSGFSPVSPVFVSAGCCRARRRRRQWVNDAFLQVCAAYSANGYRGACGVSGDVWGAWCGVAEQDGWREFHQEMRERRGRPEAPALERVLRGCGDAWHRWEPFRNCTEEQERAWLAQLCTSACSDVEEQQDEETMEAAVVDAGRRLDERLTLNDTEGESRMFVLDEEEP
ncbi:hypothetical protein CDCA_CDCA07G2031 [Cyanidium caldarium]|uniref:Uncharacterized protein n=1 Tax=Cyanidium caldarium TaxID=2771 RepID=A0AAV9IVC3_CYACA|nr:hypothetical protein CDCA_CDCA07G2031 [Cyanidium caldarium]